MCIRDSNSTVKAKPKMTVKNGIVYGDALSAQEKKRIVMQKKKDRKAKKVRKSAQQTLSLIHISRWRCISRQLLYYDQSGCPERVRNA